MSLRLRLIVRILLFAIPASLVVGFLFSSHQSSMRDEFIADALQAELADAGEHWCERPSLRRHRRRLRRFEKLHAFDGSSFAPARSGRRPLPNAIRQGLEDADVASATLPGGRFALAVRLPFDGPCSVAMIVQHQPRKNGIFLGAFAAALVVLAAAFIAAGPLVRRLRKLDSLLREAGSDGELVIQAVERGKSDEITRLAMSVRQNRQSLREAAESAQHRESALREFLARTTHDTMTPLAALMARLSELGDGAQVGAAKREANYLRSLLTNLQTMAQLDVATPVEFEKINLSDIADRVYTRFSSGLDASVEFNLGIDQNPIWVQGDALLIERALSNIVGNSIRHTAKEQKKIALVLESSDGEFSVVVRDNGKGVPQDVRDYLFDEEKIKARTRHERVGLGLRIVRDICTLHGWTLAFGADDYGSFVKIAPAA